MGLQGWEGRARFLARGCHKMKHQAFCCCGAKSHHPGGQDSSSTAWASLPAKLVSSKPSQPTVPTSCPPCSWPSPHRGHLVSAEALLTTSRPLLQEASLITLAACHFSPCGSGKLPLPLLPFIQSHRRARWVRAGTLKPARLPESILCLCQFPWSCHLHSL